jgi:hypothetical protein
MWWTRAQVGVLLGTSRRIINKQRHHHHPPTHAAPAYQLPYATASQQSAKYQPLICNQLTTSSYRAAALLSLLLDISPHAPWLAVAFLLLLSSSKKCLLFYSLFYFILNINNMVNNNSST